MEKVSIQINPYHDADAIVQLLNSYASDPMGGGKELGEFTRKNLVEELKNRDWVVTLLAVDGSRPVGILIAMEGFSTFSAKPLMNIHDVAVIPEERGKGIGKKLFAAIEEESLRRGCCKLTLEVLSGNERAKRAYLSMGFKPYELNPEHGAAQFWEKPL